jgi:hypothetical protein
VGLLWSIVYNRNRSRNFLWCSNTWNQLVSKCFKKVLVDKVLVDFLLVRGDA